MTAGGLHYVQLSETENADSHGGYSLFRFSTGMAIRHAWKAEALGG
jgi:hypothetical protein